MDKESEFTEVVECHRDRIYRICCCYVVDEEARKDVFQQVLINIWCSLDTFEARAQIGTWIYRIAINTCLAHLRAEKSRRKIFNPPTGFDPDSVKDPHDTEESERREKEVQLLYDCVPQLEPVNRALISLYLEDVPTKEMADILGITEVNVRVKLHRAKKSLKTLLERNGYGTR